MSRVAIESRPSSRPKRRGRPYRSLRGHNEFARVYRTGDRCRCGPVTVIAARGGQAMPSVGFVVGKRVGSAVERNRAKRRLREAASRSNLKRDTVYVLVAERGVLTANFNSLVGWISAGAASLRPSKEKL